MDLNKLEGESVTSAVMVLQELATDSLVLTQRSKELRHHPGEICFPGGKQEACDESLYATALRELYEELGIAASRITLIKKLHKEQTLLGTIIHPWLASIASIKPYVQNLQEVAALIFIPMPLVINPLNYKDVMIEREGLRFKSCEFIPHNELIWGATARIMRQLTY